MSHHASARKKPSTRTLSLERLQAERRARSPLPIASTDDRPRTRAECPESRPCPWVGCKYHLYLDVHPRTGSIVINFPELEPWELAETCALDAAERGALDDGLTLQEVGELMNLTRERVRQVQDRALEKLARRPRKRK